LRGTAATAIGLSTAACSAPGYRILPAQRLRHGSIGVGGIGRLDLAQIRSHPLVDVVALCDVDASKLSAAAAGAPRAATFRDWRRMITEAGDMFDSVNVSVPDHMHAPITLALLRAGKHVYCQKPLTRTVAESRAVLEVSRASGVVTQMGIQGHSGPTYSQALPLLRSGVIGPVHTVHVWSDRPKGWWPQGVERPSDTDPVPESLEWDLWLGVAPERAFKEGMYHPFSWRGRQDFGTGAQGDMGCHLMDPAVWFLGLGAPLWLRSEGPAPNDESYPLWSTVTCGFARTPFTGPDGIQLTWYDGGKRAPDAVLEPLGLENVWGNACLFLGSEGALMTSPYNAPLLLPQGRFVGVETPRPGGRNHWHEWVDACRGWARPSAGFEYAAHLSEIVLLGNAALHFPGERLEWDSKRLAFPSHPSASDLLYPDYRSGWCDPAFPRA